MNSTGENVPEHHPDSRHTAGDSQTLFGVYRCCLSSTQNINGEPRNNKQTRDEHQFPWQPFREGCRCTLFKNTKEIYSLYKLILKNRSIYTNRWRFTGILHQTAHLIHPLTAASALYLSGSIHLQQPTKLLVECLFEACAQWQPKVCGFCPKQHAPHHHHLHTKPSHSPRYLAGAAGACAWGAGHQPLPKHFSELLI